MTPFTKNLSYGNIGPEVLKLQKALESLGIEKFIPLATFGPKTKKAVQNFQKRYPDLYPYLGNFANQTRRKINNLLFPKQQILHDIAVSFIGVDASPLDRANDILGCADTVNCIAKEAWGEEIGGDVSTIRLHEALKSNPNYVRTYFPKAGSIVISPTEGNNTGHTGIVMVVNGVIKIMSNSSNTGTWEANYTIPGWYAYYTDKKKLKTEFYDRKG